MCLRDAKAERCKIFLVKAIEGFPEPNLKLSQILIVLQTNCLLWDEFKVGH